MVFFGALVACEPGVEGSPSTLAEDVATGLESGELAGLPLVDGTVTDAQAQRESAWGQLQHDGLPLQVEVEVHGVSQDPDRRRAEAALRLTWGLPGEGEDLVREVPLRMRVSEGAWVASWDHALLGVPQGQVLQLEELPPPPRADIVDRDGEPLATARPVWRVGIDKTRVEGEQVADAARDLAEAADVDQDTYAASFAAAGPEAFVELITYRQEDPAGRELVAATEQIDGAVALEDELVLGPTRTFAQPLLGTVGPVSAEMVEQDPERYAAGDVAGLSGVQAVFDAELRGEPGLRVSAVEEDTGETTTLLEREPVTPDPLRLTLHSALQQAAEEALAQVGPASALVAIDHTSGDVLAVANGPGSQGAQTALAAQHPPGSTFKLASALVLLRRGVTPETTVRCEPTLVVDGYPFRNVTGYPESALGDIPLRTAMAHSCNTALISERDEIPMEELAQAGTDLGIGGVWDMPVTAFSGVVPPEAGSQTEQAASLIGQGQVLASPVAMAVVAASIGQGGTVVPRIVADQEVPPTRGSLAGEEADALRVMMRAVVTEGGASMLVDNPGPEVLAKTGTAEFGTQDPPQTHAWMVAIQGNLAVAVFVEEGEFGSTTAGPIMDAFLTDAVAMLP